MDVVTLVIDRDTDGWAELHFWKTFDFTLLRPPMTWLGRELFLSFNSPLNILHS